VGQLVFAGRDIGLLQQKLNRKNEALDMKSDMEGEMFEYGARNLLLFTVP
jgi:hypothetical protein